MPGIHVRSPSQLDWFDQEKESLLTIPGSYWLCHKKNIYKFIFKYHRPVRNTVQFSYGRELLKIIRRIIKCHPTQGQQFGTQHLLVTYNCTSWTRQDKMFAIMKFQQRTNAAAFSHAFVLTVRTFPSSECSLFDLKYPIVKEADAGATFKDLNVSLDAEEKIINTTISTTDKVSLRNDAKCQTKKIDQISKYNAIENVLSKTLEPTINSNFQDGSTEDSTVFRENPDQRIATTRAEMHFADNRNHNTEFHNNLQEIKSISCNTERCENNVEQHSIDCMQEQSLRANTTDEIKEAGEIKKEETKFVVIQKSLSLKSFPRVVKDNTGEWLLIEKFNFDEKSIEKDDTCIINNKDNLNNKETTDESIVDSSNVHQYLNEEETKNTKTNLIIDQSKQKNLQTEIKNVSKDKDCISKMTERNSKFIYTKQKDRYNETMNLEENDRERTGTLINVDDKQFENNTHGKSSKTRKQKSKDSDRKIIPEKVLRSSNITDLVMEGLMFTIRQDQDSIAVIEQKTKLEMDEVLENSEKVETKAGEKCLLNSSLLRLENLVTMIDSPRNKNEQHKNSHAVGNGANLPSFGFSRDIVHDVNINYVDAEMDKSGVFNYDRRNAINHSTLYQSQWQRQCVSPNIENNDGCSTSEISIEKAKNLMEWQNEQDKKCKSNIEMEKREEDIVPEISSFNKLNVGLQNTNLLMINKNNEEIGKCDKSAKEHLKSQLPYSSLNLSKICTDTIFVNSEESNLIKLSQQEANVPRIISNKAITIEQMPPALQKVLQHTYRGRRFSSPTSSETLEQNEQKMQSSVLTEYTVSKADDLLEDKSINSNIMDNSLSIEFAINSEKIENNNEKSCVTIEKNVSQANRNTRSKNLRTTKTQRTLRRSPSLKHGSPRKLQDITEEFYYDLLHVHNKDNAIRQKCLRQKQKSLNNPDVKNGKVHIQMLKFIQDITEGARVVVRRLNIDNKSNLLEKNSNLI
ncbi:uncharacterized protein LOC105207379 [Solenopsis invicta]|uniref:uncharacterized protein LOC105207379 n=1 Tax=Solenopsis invicta TaxID=13686 RepID=UPI00193DBE1C|nr:uncharacterized protein LOC105207379 [Solenopsis invicta]XP_011175112.2 uncharacterized protein LOC105207379 [Solenopsis invicta]XP_039308413.1 uncharacterized protein LOC105207379 [Solenopsis invicta]XP_039308414.1 uncharacterized protein LOC105207379 [Solenopsis invicta]XP_039308415.1 uncharacterized protein LOC105207379 [Solenopsis invicta]